VCLFSGLEGYQFQQGQPEQTVHEAPYPKLPEQNGLAVWLKQEHLLYKCKALSSNLGPTKKNKKPGMRDVCMQREGDT
jgi:hypothetical protein